MSRKQAISRPPATSPSPHLPTSPSLPRGLMLGWLAALLTARWLIPTEGAAEGLTLWLVQLVLLTAVIRAAWGWRLDEGQIRFDKIDVAIACLVMAQVVSAVSVVFGVGNARAAINLAWEWIGSGVLIGLLRHELRASHEHTMRDVKSLCWGLSLAAGVLAGFGLWQHYVVFDETTREYERLTAEHDRLAESKSDPRRQATLQVEMTRQGIPIEPAARQMLEQRLKASREPFGLFALANSFAGLLSVMLLVTAGNLRSSSTARKWSGSAGAIGLMLVIGFCLVLTKSRTAWVGLAAGIGWWVLRAILERRQHSQEAAVSPQRSTFAKWGVIGLVVIGMAIGIAAVSGGLDRAVLSEAPKSLRYRLEYWQGTWATIREHLWFGTGPGNFRDYYLAHKLPESSEEIADPHNFVLDVWANAGTFGLIGLLSCVGLMVGQVFNLSGRRTIRRAASLALPVAELARVQTRSLATSATGNILPAARLRGGHVENVPHGTAAWGVGFAFPVGAIGLELFGHGEDQRLWWLGGIWWLLWLGSVAWSRLRDPFQPETPATPASEAASLRLPIALEAASVALLVHLLGAGGIAMPAITQLWWLLWALRAACFETGCVEVATNLPSESDRQGVQAVRVQLSAVAVVLLGLCVACGITATMPELFCRTSLQMGDAEWERHQANSALARYRDAANADRWAIEPLNRMAEISFLSWQQTRTESDFDDVLRKNQAVIDRLPFASRPYRRLGQVWQRRFERSNAVSDATHSARALEAAVARYPHHAELLSELAIACAEANQTVVARDAARRAIQQDDLNHHAGHSDKYLPEMTRLRMQQLVDVTQSGAN